jgi:hypothetical protein
VVLRSATVEGIRISAEILPSDATSSEMGLSGKGLNPGYGT